MIKAYIIYIYSFLMQFKYLNRQNACIMQIYKAREFVNQKCAVWKAKQNSTSAAPQ